MAKKCLKLFLSFFKVEMIKGRHFIATWNKMEMQAATMKLLQRFNKVFFAFPKLGVYLVFKNRLPNQIRPTFSCFGLKFFQPSLFIQLCEASSFFPSFCVEQFRKVFWESFTRLKTLLIFISRSERFKILGYN